MVKFCLIGAGRAGLVHALNIKNRIKNAEMVALCDANSDTLKQVGQDLGVSALFSDYKEAVSHPGIDAVIIVTPTFLHSKIACAAAEAGKHIFLEKPMAITVDECKAINSAAKKAGVRLQIGFMRRFDNSFLRAKEILDTGEMGRIMIIKSTGRGPGLPARWMYDIDQSNGILAEVNSHDFDSVRWLAGSDISRVYAEADNFKCPDAKAEYPRFYDNAMVNLRFASGTLGSVDGTCPCHYGYDARVEVLCEKGVLQIGTTHDHTMAQITLDGKASFETVKSWRTLFKDAYLAEMEHFISCVESGETPRVTGLDGLKAVQTVVAANQSIAAGRPIEIRGQDAL